MKKAMLLLSCMFLMIGMTAGTLLAMGKKAESMVCPSCNAQTVTKPRPKGGEYARLKHLCPSCGKEHMGTATGEKMHVCSECGAEISLCPVCKSKS